MDHLSSKMLSIVIPTYNEIDNIEDLIEKLTTELNGLNWEVIFVDDDSPDLTADKVHAISKVNPRVRGIHRVGRRGLSSACIEGVLSASSDIVGIMDADMQHDETKLKVMLDKIVNESADLVIGTRYAEEGGEGEWKEKRKKLSKVGKVAEGLILKTQLSDPMSGFFMFKRSLFVEVVPNLSGIGFKILLDFVSSCKKDLKIEEVPYVFKERAKGQSKLSELVIFEYGVLLLDKFFGSYFPVRFIMFSLIGSLGVLIHMTFLTLCLKGFQFNFLKSQIIATMVAMVFNFTLNNLLTYRDKTLKNTAWLKGLVSFMLACSVGGLSNIGISNYLFKNETVWYLAAFAGVLVGAGWNYAVTQIYTWGRTK